MELLGELEYESVKRPASFNNVLIPRIFAPLLSSSVNLRMVPGLYLLLIAPWVKLEAFPGLLHSQKSPSLFALCRPGHHFTLDFLGNAGGCC